MTLFSILAFVLTLGLMVPSALDVIFVQRTLFRAFESPIPSLEDMLTVHQPKTASCFRNSLRDQTDAQACIESRQQWSTLKSKQILSRMKGRQHDLMYVFVVVSTEDYSFNTSDERLVSLIKAFIFKSLGDVSRVFDLRVSIRRLGHLPWSEHVQASPGGEFRFILQSDFEHSLLDLNSVLHDEAHHCATCRSQWILLHRASSSRPPLYLTASSAASPLDCSAANSSSCILRRQTSSVIVDDRLHMVISNAMEPISEAAWINEVMLAFKATLRQILHLSDLGDGSLISSLATAADTASAPRVPIFFIDSFNETAPLPEDAPPALCTFEGATAPAVLPVVEAQLCSQASKWSVATSAEVRVLEAVVQWRLWAQVQQDLAHFRQIIDKIEHIPVTAELAHQVDSTVQLLDCSIALYRSSSPQGSTPPCLSLALAAGLRGKHSGTAVEDDMWVSLQLSRQALQLSSELSSLPLTSSKDYFPWEQKLSILAPFWIPIMVPLIKGLVTALKEHRKRA